MGTTRRSKPAIGLLGDARSAAPLARPANFRRTQQRVHGDARKRLEQLNFEDAAASEANALLGIVALAEAPVRRAVSSSASSGPLWWAAYAAWRLVDEGRRLLDRSSARRR